MMNLNSLSFVSHVSSEIILIYRLGTSLDTSRLNSSVFCRYECKVDHQLG